MGLFQKSIKYRILTSYLLAVTLILGAIIGLVSWKISERMSHQSEVIAGEMRNRMEANLGGNNLQKVFDHFIDNIRDDVGSAAEKISVNPILPGKIEARQYNYLNDFLGTSCEISDVNLAMIFDLDGGLQSSFPVDVNALTIEDFYSRLGLKEIISADASADTCRLSFLAKFNPALNKAFGLEKLAVSGEDGLIVLSTALILDDFGDPIGVCLAGKVLNEYSKYLRQLHDITGRAFALYIDNRSIASAGFDASTEELAIDRDIVSEIYQSGESRFIDLRFGGIDYVSACIPVETFSKEKVGVFLAAVKQEQITAIQQQMTSYSTATMINLQKWLIAVGITSFLIFGLISWILSSGIVRPIRKLIDMTKNLAAVDFAGTSNDVHKDEIGILEDALLSMVSLLREVVSTVGGAAEHVLAGSEQMKAVTGFISQEIQEQASAVEQISATIEQVSTSIKNNAENAQLSREKIMSMVQMAQNSGEMSMKLVVAMDEILNMSRKIGGISDTVNHVSFQTNLLALNAAVEAARAGEHGKGFAVVAGEVRGLAKLSSDATCEIQALIEDAGCKISVGDSMTRETGKAFKEIIEHIETLSPILETIAASSSEQALRVDELNKAINQIETSAQQNASSVEEYASTVESLTDEAKALNAIVQKFNI